MQLSIPHAVYRYYMINKLLSHPDYPEVRERMSVVPTHKVYSSAPEAIQTVDLGYATFDIGLAEEVTRLAVGGRGTAVRVSNSSIALQFLIPHNTKPYPGEFTDEVLAQASKENPELVKKMRLAINDPIQAEIEMEQTQLATFWELRRMTHEEYLAYFVTVSKKSTFGLGLDRVISFQSPSTKGVIRIGGAIFSNRYAQIVIGSPNGEITLGFHVDFLQPNNIDLLPMLECIASSFRFTVEEIPSDEELAKLISDSGIPHIEQSQPPDAPDKE